MSRAVAKIAVSAATYWLDKPYDYLLPPELLEILLAPFEFNTKDSL